MADKKLIVSLGADISGLKKSMKDVKSSVKGATDGVGKSFGSMPKAAKSAGDSIKNTFKNVGIVIAAALAVDKLVDFGKFAVESAASAKALSAQFEQVFGEQGANAQKMVDDMAGQFGMLPNRIKPSFTATTSMFKGLGLTTEEAMEQATKAVTMASDAAAFYDKSYEDANGALNSFIKGNYEGGESIGLFANETQMAAWAADNLGTDWKSLDEAGKQIIRLKYAEAMQESAGATGQASRESEGWENQLGNLKQALADVAAVIGEPIMDLLIAGIQAVVPLLQVAGEKITVFKEQIGVLWEQFKDSSVWAVLSGFIQLVVDKVTGFKSEFENLKTSLLDSSIWETLKGYLGQVVEFWTGLFSGEGNLGTIFMKIFEMVRSVAVPILQDAMNFIQEIISQVTAFWSQHGAQITQAVQNAFSIIAGIIQFFMPFIQGIISTIWGNIKGLFQGALDAIMGLAKIFTGIFTGDWSMLWEGVKQTLKGALQFAWNLINLIMFKNMLGGIKGFVTNGIASIKGFFTGIVNSAKSGLSTFQGTWNLAKNAVVKIITTLKNTGASIFNGFKSVVSTIFSSLKSLMTKPFTSAWNVIKGIVNKLKNAFNFSWKLPKFKLPSISVSMKKNSWGIPYPDFDVSWFATGGIATGPSVVGIGEAGDEAILPLSNKTKMKPFAQAVASMMPNDGGDSNGGSGDVIITGNTLVVREEADIKRVAFELKKLEDKERRPKGKRG